MNASSGSSGQARANIRQVAEEAEVSAATVSRVLNNPDSVRPEVVARVQAAVQRLDYRPNRSARGLRAGRTIQRVGFLVSNIQNPFFTGVLKGVEQVLIANQIAIIVGNSNDDADYELFNLDLMFEEQVNGLIVQLASSRPKHYLGLMNSAIPIVCFDHMPVGLGVDTVIVNNCAAMRQATEHLIEQGHTFFGLVGGPVDYMTGRERQAGFLGALRAAGIGEDRTFIENGDWHLNGSYVAASRLLARAPLPIAVATANNDATIATLKVIRERGLRIPEDVALVCFDEMPWTAGYNPPLTVVDQHPYHTGAVAAELLLSRMRHPDRPVQQVMLEAELIVRESSRLAALTTTQ